MASLIGFPNESTGLGAAFSCLGFLVSRLLRFWPLAMIECPFHQSGFGIIWHAMHGFEAVLSRDALMTLVIIANPILGRCAFWWQHAGDAIDASGLEPLSKTSPQPNGLTDGVKMRCTVAPRGTMRILHDRRCAHDVLLSCSCWYRDALE